MSQQRLFGKTVLVSGASRGIGLAIAEAVSANGAKVILGGRSSSLPDIAARLNGTAVSFDLANFSSIAAVTKELPPVDVLINVAGMNLRKPFEEYDVAEIQQIFQVNVFGPMHLTQFIGKRMIEQQTGGKIITIGSLTTLLGIPYLSIYGASKGAVGQWTLALAAEWGRHKIQANCIVPGFILTDLTQEMWQDPRMKTWLAAAQPNSRLGKPEDIGALAVYLSSSESDYVTGQVFAIDGGHSTSAMWPFEPNWQS